MKLLRVWVPAVLLLCSTAAGAPDTTNAPLRMAPPQMVASPKEWTERWEAAKRRWEAAPLEAVRKAAAGGDHGAQHYLGSYYAAKPTRDQESLKEAFRWYEMAAQEGDVVAQTALGRMHLKGSPSGGINGALVLYWLSQAAESGYAPAYFHLGEFYLEDRALDTRRFPANFVQAQHWFRKGVEAGEPNGDLGLGFIYAWGLGVVQNLPEARKWLQRAAAKNISAAEVHLGRIAELRDIPEPPGAKPDYAEAAKWYRLAANHTNATGTYLLARLYLDGHSGTWTEGAALLKKAVALDYWKAREELADLYLAGHIPAGEGPQDAIKAYQAAADAGYESGLLGLGRLHREGKNLPKDLLRAVQLYHRAAQRGSLEAAEWLEELARAQRSSSPPAASREAVEKYQIYRHAIYEKNAASARKIAGWYESGVLPKNLASACTWLVFAAKLGDAGSKADVDRLRPLIKPEEMQLAERQAEQMIMEGQMQQ